MQKWEYKLVVRRRGWPAKEKDKAYILAGEWNLDMEQEVSSLGEEGWE